MDDKFRCLWNMNGIMSFTNKHPTFGKITSDITEMHV
jgi:hypothetical protein